MPRDQPPKKRCGPRTNKLNAPSSCDRGNAMNLPRRRLLHLAAGAAALQALARSARAQGYPSKPITIIAPFGPGSASDTVARVVAQHLAAALYVARATPDGYTLFLSSNSPHAPPALLTIPTDDLPI